MKERHMFMIRLCSDHAAYEAVPRKKISLDMSALKRIIGQEDKWTITIYTSRLLVMRRDDSVEVTVVDDGRMIIRNITDEKSAGEIAEAILPVSAITR